MQRDGGCDAAMQVLQELGFDASTCALVCRQVRRPDSLPHISFEPHSHSALQTNDPETAVALALSMAEQPAALQFSPAPAAPSALALEKFKMVVVVRGDLGMSAGKVAAQSVHAALAAYRQALAQSPQFVRAWEAQGEATICVQCSGEQELQVRHMRCDVLVAHDGMYDVT